MTAHACVCVVPELCLQSVFHRLALSELFCGLLYHDMLSSFGLGSVVRVTVNAAPAVIELRLICLSSVRMVLTVGRSNQAV